MPIEKLEEFARDGQKNTDDLTLTDGFPVLLKPARQWFNWLFHSITSKINEVIDLDPIARSEIINNLTTNDADKVASARTVKILQDNKLESKDLKDATTEEKGVVKLNNTLTSTSTGQALTAAQGKALNDQAFGVGQTWQNVLPSRVVGTTYTNTTGRAIFIVIIPETMPYGVSLYLKVDGVDVGHTSNQTAYPQGKSMYGVVPAGSTYVVTGNNTISVWSELR